jgi:LysM repeat protein
MAGRWSWEDGRPVTVGFGDTIDNIGFKYGVPKSAVLEANGLTDKTTLFLGQQIMIPHYATVEEQRRILREMANGEIHDLQPDK